MEYVTELLIIIAGLALTLSKEVVRAFILRLIVGWLMDKFQKFYVKTADEQAIWEHHIRRGHREGHKPLLARNCTDGQCASLKRKVAGQVVG